MEFNEYLNLPEYFELGSGIKEEIAALGLLIRDTDSGLIAFALYHGVANRELVSNALREHISLPLHEFTLSSQQNNPIELLYRVPSSDRGCIFFYGLEDALPTATGYLNLQREYFSEIPHAIVFWVSEYGLREIANKAPDFWAWRSGVFDFRRKGPLPSFAIKALSLLPLNLRDKQNLEQRIELYQELLKEYSEQKEPEDIFLIRLQIRLGNVYVMLRNFKEAYNHAQEALKLSNKIRNDRLKLIALVLYGLILIEKFKIDEAESVLKEAKEIAKKYDDEESLSHIYYLLGISAYNQDKFTQAETLTNKSLEIKKHLKEDQNAFDNYHLLGSIALSQNQIDSAEKWFKKALTICLHLDLQNDVADEFHHLGLVSHQRNQFEQAEYFFRKALEIRTKLGWEGDSAPTYYELGRIFQERQDFDQAEKFYLKSLEIAENFWNSILMIRIFSQLGELSMVQGKIIESFKYLGKSYILSRKFNKFIDRTLIGLAIIMHVTGGEHFSILWHQTFPDQDLSRGDMEKLGSISKKISEIKEKQATDLNGR